MAEPTEAQRKRSQARERRRGQTASTEDRPGDGVVEGSEEPLEAVKHAAKVAAAGAAMGAAAAAARALASRSDDEHESEPAAEVEETPAAAQESPAGEPGPPSDEPAAEADEAPEPEHEPEPEAGPSRTKPSEKAPAALARDENEEPVRGASPDEATETVERARRQLSGLLERPVESVSAFERMHDGWLVTLEVVEVSRIPESTDVLASYEVELDDDRNLRRYARVRRYIRSQADRGDQQ
jgi:hypothetical protein